MSNPTAILTADWGLRDTKPACRLDEDYIQTQERKVKFIRDLQEEYGCPILHAGDLLDRWNTSPWLLGWMISILPERIITVPGNHDLPGHSLDRLDESGLYVLAKAGKISLYVDGQEHLEDFSIRGIPWGLPIDKKFSSSRRGIPSVCIAHIEVYQGKPPYPGADPSGEARKLLRRFPQYDLILTGHNHAAFVEEHEGRLLVNPGSLCREDADQVDHKPRVYLWYAKEKRVEPVFTPIEKGMVSREHLDSVKAREDRNERFLAELKTPKKITIDFTKNLEKYLKANKIRPGEKELCWEFTEKGAK